MGLFNFFRKKGIEKKREKIDFSDIENWAKKKKKEVKEKEKEALILVQEKINILLNELKEKINVVKSINIEEKKVEDKIKFIVTEGRKKYIECVERFIESLSSLKKEGLEESIKDINKIFLEFDKSSHMSYERATILIGKEMAEIKKSLQIFSKDLIKIFYENKNVVDLLKTISIIRLELKQVTEIEGNLNRINGAIIHLDKKINEKEKENKRFFKEIEIIKKSKDYLKNLEKQTKIKLLEEELEKDIFSLSQLVDFKKLANFFHIFNEQMEIIKAHRKDFQTNFRKDGGQSIIKLLDESKLNNKEISEKIKQISDRKREIAKTKQEIKKDKSKKLYAETAKINLEIENLKNKKQREEKRKEKLVARKKTAIEEVKRRLGERGVEIIEREKVRANLK